MANSRGGFGERAGADLIGLGVAGGVRGHVGEHEIGLAAECLQQGGGRVAARGNPFRRNVAPVSRFDRQEIDADDFARAALQRHLQPSRRARRRDR